MSLENIFKEKLSIYIKYSIKYYTLDEQNEIINEFLDVIDAKDMIREFKDIFYHSSSNKYDNIEIALKQSDKLELTARAHICPLIRWNV